MDMKEICRKMTSLLGDCISDSFYDDEGGDYVELYIGGTGEFDIEIDIDQEYFGFSFGDHCETYAYDENAAENAEMICKKIKRLLSGELCGVAIFEEKSFLPISEITETSKADAEHLNALLKERAVKGSGHIEIFRRGCSAAEKHFFEGGILTG